MAARLLLLVASACAAKTCNDLFEDGVEAYLENRWLDCVENLEAALADYHEYRRNVVLCRSACQSEAAHAPPLYRTATPDQSLAFYEEKLRATLCLLKCRKDYFTDRSPVPRTLDLIFEARRPYEYLHLCYFQRRQLQDAASAAFTFLARNPDDEVMLSNLKYYTSLPEVKMEDIRNYEAEEFVAPYIKGMTAYDTQDYESVITFMEESLEKYIEALAECRTYCEGPFDQGWFPDFTSSISNHFTYCLKCKEKCQDKLNLVNGERHDDLLESHYHYLQFSYYKVGNMKKAREAVESYLLFHPDDEVMLKNKRFYSEDKNTQTSMESSPRPEAVQYFNILEHEKRLLKFIRSEFKFGSEAEVSSNEIEQNNIEVFNFKKYQNVSTIKLFPPPIVKIEKNNTIEEKPPSDEHDKVQFIEIVHKKKVSHIDKQLLKERAVAQLKTLSSKNITVTKGEAELHGKQRFLAEGFVKESECSKLIQLAEVAGVLGDGYNGKTSPHTSYEKFEGVTLGRAAMVTKTRNLKDLMCCTMIYINCAFYI